MLTLNRTLRALAAISLTTGSALASFTPLISLHPGAAYQQNFDQAVPASGYRGPSLPEGWYTAQTIRRGTVPYRFGSGRETETGFQSYGSPGSTDRALGSLQGRSPRPDNLVFGAGFLNDGSEALTRFEIQYVGEEWRLTQTCRREQLDFQYSTDANSLTSGHWTDVNALDFRTPNTQGRGVKDGNAPENRTEIESTLSLVVPAGGQFWIRWLDRRAPRGGNGLAVDDFVITSLDEVTPVPELSTYGFGAGLCLMALVWARKRRPMNNLVEY